MNFFRLGDEIECGFSLDIEYNSMSFNACIDFYQRRTSKNNMAAFREVVMLKIALARRRRRNLSFQVAMLVAVRRKFRLRLLALLCLLRQQVGEEEERVRSVQRCERNAGWWKMV